MRRVVLGVIVLSAATVFAQQPSDADVRRVMAQVKFKQAVAFLDRDHDRLVRETIQLTEIPAPPFKEAARGRVYLEMLRAHGLTNVEQDAEGNVMGVRKGKGGGPLIAVAAHLDTVFPEGTDVRVRHDGTRLSAPGVGDDSRSLAVVLAMIRAMDAAKIQTTSDILFIGDVGEEGLGDLRGMKYLFQKGPYKDRIKMFISIDDAGNGEEIHDGAVGSLRYRVTFKGPGGHSYTAFGLVSPSLAMGHAIDMLSHMIVPLSPKTTFNVGVLGGGTSVNAIPTESWMEVDMRSESRDELEKLAKTFLGLVSQAVDDENRDRSTTDGKVSADAKLVGDRPSGQTPQDSVLTTTAAAAVRAMGMAPRFSFASNDSNIPISLGIPAITISSGGEGGRSHALDEWIDVEKTKSLRGVQTALVLLLTLAGLQ
jgi:acetylornithine deacetylase/succinyl-diaminopimelate desuccinylase-like protein